MQKATKNNKTTNLSRAILMLVKNANPESEKTLLTKLETACYDLIDITHNDETKIYTQLKYMIDLLVVARQVNVFLEENIIFIMNVISEISKTYETKSETKNEEIINEKIRNILEDGEMSETENLSARVSNLYIDKRQEEIKKEIKNLEKLSETKSNNLDFSDQKSLETKKTDYSGRQQVENNTRKLSRREEVLKTLSSVPVSIKEVSEKVLGCSEKTLQRELNALVDKRQAIRVGEKRWSRYILA